MRSCSALLAISLAATSCAGPSATSQPASLTAPTLAEIEEDGVANILWHGIPMVAFTDAAFARLLIRHRTEKRDLELALTNQTIDREVAEAEAKRLRESQSRTAWAATYGPWLGFAGGLTVAGLIAAVLGGVLKR